MNRSRSSWRVAAAVALGCTANPLNSSMIALALADVHRAFRISLATASLLISVFYLASCVLHPLAGRLADRFGARRTYCVGLAIVGLSGLLAAAPQAGFGELMICRVLLAAGSAAAFPSALVLLRSGAGTDPPAGELGFVAVAQSAAAAGGTALGGLLVALGGWRAVFVVNVPLAVVGLAVALCWLPTDPGPGRGDDPRPVARAGLRDLDLPGAGLFAATTAGLVAFLVSVRTGPLWPVLAVAGLAGALLIRRELGAGPAFLGLRELVHNGRLAGVVLAQFAFQGCFYLIFFGFPLWLAQARGFPGGTVAALALPLTALSVAMTPLAVRVVRRYGSGRAVVVGSAAMLVASAAMLRLGDASATAAILLVAGLLGLPGAFTNLGLQTALYRAVPPDRLGTAAGLFQTARYLGVMLLTPLLGVVSHTAVDSAALHQIGWGAIAVALTLILASALAVRRLPGRAGGAVRGSHGRRRGTVAVEPGAVRVGADRKGEPGVPLDVR